MLIPETDKAPARSEHFIRVTVKYLIYDILIRAGVPFLL